MQQRKLLRGDLARPRQRQVELAVDDLERRTESAALNRAKRRIRHRDMEQERVGEAVLVVHLGRAHIVGE
jgi:hypothetical protein